MSAETIALSIAAPDRPGRHIDCDSVHLTLDGGEDDRNAGSYGIRPGHAASLFALGPGPLTVYRKNQLIFSASLQKGLAVFRNNTLTIITESFEETPGKTD